MLLTVYETIAREKDFLGALASIATVFALLVPLPAYVVSTISQRAREARERAFSLISRVDSGESRALRDRVLQIMARGNLVELDAHGGLTDQELGDLRQFMNEQELIGLHLNTSRIDRRVFLAFWRSAFIKDWKRFEDYVAYHRANYGPKFYIEWETAVENAKREPRQ